MTLWSEQLYSVLKDENTNGVFELDSNKFTPYSEIMQESIHLARRFPGNRRTVSVCLRNSKDYIVAYLASVLSGSIFAPIPFNLSFSEIPKILDYQESDYFIYEESREIEFGKLSQERSPVSFTIEELRDQSPRTINNDLDEDDVGFLYYSSGTTGDPKGVLYSYQNKMSLISAITNDFAFSKNTKHLAILPFGHTASLNYSVFPSLYCGSNLFVADGFASVRGRFMQILSSFEINYVQVVPTIIQSLISFPEENRPELNRHLKFIGCGSAPLFSHQQIQFQSIYGLPVANLYGLSETGPTHFDNPTEPGWLPGSIGRPLSVNQCRIIEDGEIQVKGPNVFVGYHRNTSSIKDIAKDGWFSTGDYGEIKDGRYYFLDRKKDLIIVGGANVLPAEIEEVVLEHEAVEECAAFALEDSYLGEIPGILVKLKESTLVDNSQTEYVTYLLATKKSIVQLCKGLLSTYKVPKKFFFTNDILPRTESGKISRRKCKAVALAKGGAV